MKSLNILFLGSPVNYSQQVKKDLIKANFNLIEDPTKANLIITACHGQIIPQETLDLPQYGALNIHPSLLPKYRGAAPVPWTLLNQEKTTGVTIIKMTDKVDAGPILAQEKIKINSKDTADDLLHQLFQLGTKLLIKVLPKYIDHIFTPIDQPLKSPTPYARKLTKADGFITWEQFKQASTNNFSSLDHQVRALYPWPGVWTKMADEKVLKLLPNQLLQLEGKQPINLKQFRNGYQHLLK
jgi:methionyl-tRNA formyltransferase